MTIGWVTTEEVRARYGDDVPLDVATLESLLQAAYELCSAYAPAVVPSPIPERYLLAQMEQAKSMWEASRKSGDELGPEGFAIRIFPMDWSVKNLLRPKRGLGSVG